MKKKTKDILFVWMFILLLIIVIDLIYFSLGGTLESKWVQIPICLEFLIMGRGVITTIEMINENKELTQKATEGK